VTSAEGETVLGHRVGQRRRQLGCRSRGPRAAPSSRLERARGASVDKLARARAIGASVALDSRRADLADAVLDATGGNGVDVVSISRYAAVGLVIRTLRPWGRYVTTGVTAGHRVDLHLGQVFVKGLTITGVVVDD